jgi:nucleotide-binding universal stress UspA family protein
MRYATLMANLTLARSNAGLLGIVGDLAGRFDAGVVGIAVCQPIPLAFGDGGYTDGTLVEAARREFERELEAAALEFRTALGRRVVAHRPWRGEMLYASLADHVARQARSVDLVITAPGSKDLFDTARSVDTGDLVMQAGRPVLVVPPELKVLTLQHALVAWKDSRESRRAIRDGLPMLKLAAKVTLVEMAAPTQLDEARSRLEDVAAWLALHGVKAELLASPSTDADASGLYTLAQDLGADLVVAGAYGHSRLREWVLGGVTRDLLLRSDRCSLLSH